MSLTRDQQRDLQAQLQQAVIACNDRCLYFAAKWAAELLNSFSTGDDDDDDDDDDAADADPNADHVAQEPASDNPTEARREARELPRYLMARSFFDCREYDRCAAVFLPQQVCRTIPVKQTLSPSQLHATPGNPGKAPARPVPPRTRATAVPTKCSQKSLFLALYARFLAGEKRKNEDSETILGPADGPMTANKEVAGIMETLDEYFDARGGLQNMNNSQGWLDYLYGLMLIKSKSEPLAKRWLLRSVTLNPYNWSAWLELASLIGSHDDLCQISEQLPRHVIAFFFHIHCSQELYLQTPDALHRLSQMQAIFPSSAFLAQQEALLHYHARDHETATHLFDELVQAHPHRLEGLEVYSNLLYVLPNRPKLANLAAAASATDKFRPETNCVLGNYYSLIAEHEKAVLHFRRALTLDRNFQAAWTLMGHEYIELKNTQAAIESYRRAVDINQKDYRAWYGLGQGYEMLECHSYSLFYYQRAAALCPGDPKMWAAVGHAYAKCGKLRHAIQACKRALAVGAQMDGAAGAAGLARPSRDPLAHAVAGALDPQILYDIALLQEREARFDEAAAYMELCLAQEEGPDGDGDGSGDGNANANSDANDDTGDANDPAAPGLGVTQITSRARLWLAKWSYTCRDWPRTLLLANELCQDGVEVEEAKGLVKDVRARMAMEGGRAESD